MLEAEEKRKQWAARLDKEDREEDKEDETEKQKKVLAERKRKRKREDGNEHWTTLIVNVKKGRVAETKKEISELVELMCKEIEKEVRLEMAV